MKSCEAVKTVDCNSGGNRSNVMRLPVPATFEISATAKTIESNRVLNDTYGIFNRQLSRV